MEMLLEMNYEISKDVSEISLTEDEKKWLDILKYDQKIYDELEITEDKYIYLAQGMIDFITLILKYDNLKVEELNKVTKRLIRVRRLIPQYIMDLNSRTYILIGGLYMVADVIFIDTKKSRKFQRNPTISKKKIGIPEEAYMSTVRSLPSKGVDVVLADKFLASEIGVTASRWEYPDLW